MGRASPQIRSRRKGVTLLELMMALVIAGLLAAVSFPTYKSIVARRQVEAAVQDLVYIAHAIERYRTLHLGLPESLDDVPSIPRQDPWGYDYKYLNFASKAPGVNGKIRKDHNLHPLNSEFDLYSVGPDGKSVSPLTAKSSRDDVLWARDGSFVGVASDY